MALFSKKKRDEQQRVDGFIEDYYIRCDLDKTATREENLATLRNKFGETTQKRGSGATNSIEIHEYLREWADILQEAIKIFKNPESYDQYNKKLQIAYANNQVDLSAQKASDDIIKEIERLYIAGKYRQVVSRCMEQIEKGVVDINIYLWLAKTYWVQSDNDQALDIIDKGLKIDSNNVNLMKIESRIYTDEFHDYDGAQTIINKIITINESAGTAEQVNLYTAFGKEDIAYKTIDEYIELYPNDQVFREICATDLVGRAYSCYEPFDRKDGSGQKGWCLASEEAYEKCLKYTEKAVEINPCDETKKELFDAQSYGEVVFNEDNRMDIGWCTISALTYSVCLIMPIILMLTQIPSQGLLVVLFGILLVAVLFGPLTYISWKLVLGLKEVSYRPYWQIMKYEIYGERLPREKKYLFWGKLVSFVMRISWKIMWGMLKLLFRFI